MEHSALRCLAATLLPGVVVFVVLFTVRTPVLHTRSYWSSPTPKAAAESAHFLDDISAGDQSSLDSRRVSKRSESSNEWSGSHLIGLRDVEDPGACLKDTACRGFLKGQARDSYTQCMARVRKYGHSKKAKDNGCHFIDGKGRGVVALTSFPGSGNTWVRSLLEKATGICTGSYTCDMSLRYEGFTGEGIQSPNVVAVKTHQAAPHWGDEKSSVKFNSAIVLVRNPLDALVSDWNRYVANGFQFKTVRLGTHTQKAGREYFRNNSGWNSFVLRRAHLWKEMIDNWVINTAKSHKHRVLVVMYEDLKNNEDEEIKRMIKFLQLGSSSESESSDEELSYTRPSKIFTTTFYRKHDEDDGPFDPFTVTQRNLVMDLVAQTQKRLEKHKLKSILDVSRYVAKEDARKFMVKMRELGNRT